MKNTFYIFLIMTICSCIENEKSIQKSITLENELGKVSIELPKSFASKRSFHLSDCGCRSNKVNHIFYDSLYNNFVLPDTTYGFSSSNLPDNIRIKQFIISQSQCIDSIDNELEYTSGMLEEKVNYLKAINNETEIVISKIKLIDNKQFLITGSRYKSNTGNGYWIETLDAETSIKNRLIDFSFQKTGAEPSNFIDEMYSVFKKMEIEE